MKTSAEARRGVWRSRVDELLPGALSALVAGGVCLLVLHGSPHDSATRAPEALEGASAASEPAHEHEASVDVLAVATKRLRDGPSSDAPATNDEPIRR
ncbi:MAG TPA: hypothetical protein VMU47_08210 [Caldimonas sp.]|nr:hypothetical protein [Caldimonas sp.]